MDEFDYVIVGGGSAGSLLTRRLIDAGHSVCVLEAGPPDRNPFIHIPAGFVKTLFNPAVTWRFETEPTSWTGGRRIATTQGRALGGSSSINGMVFVRGHPCDYDMWAQRGNRGWGYADVLPYLKRLERRLGPGDDAYRGRDGALPVTDIDWHHPLCEAFIAGAARAGFPRNPDYNGASQLGTGYYQRVIHERRRVSAARAYLYPVLQNTSLDVRTNCQVSEILTEGRRAIGVRYRIGRTGGATRDVRARREVIVAAGAVNSPKLLQLSGIGPASLLREVGIGIRHDLAGVGENLSDHYSPRIVVRVKGVQTINEMVRGPRLLGQMARWAAGRPSVLALSAALVYAFGKSDPALDFPDFTIICTPASFRAGFLGVLDRFPGMTVGAWQMRPQSRGFVRVRSTDPAEAPIIQPNYLDQESDRRVLLAAIRAARRILGAAELRQYYDREELPGMHVASDDELLSFARQYGSSCYHLAGTCRMGPASDRGAVVDDQLRVHGMERLRVVDASVMPAVPSANTYASTLMIAEKASDLLLGRAAPSPIIAENAAAGTTAA